MALLKEYANGYPCLAEQPKVIQKLRLYHTNMHLRLCHIQRQRLYRTVLDSTLIPRDNVRAETETHRHEQKYKDIVKHLEKYDSSNRHVCQLRMRGSVRVRRCAPSISYRTTLQFTEPITGELEMAFIELPHPALGWKLKTLASSLLSQLSHSTNLTSPY